MVQFFRKSVMRWLVAFFLGGALVTIIMVAYLAFHYSRVSLEAAAFNQLSVVNGIRKDQVTNYLKERFGDMKMLSGSRDIIHALKLLKAYHHVERGDSEGLSDVSKQKYKDICEAIDPLFKRYSDNFGYEDVYLISGSHGHVMYTTGQNQDVGSNLRTGPFKDSGLARLWAKIVKKQDIALEDFATYGPIGKVRAFVGAPVFDENNAVAAVVAAQINPKQLRTIIRKKDEMGRTGETFLVGEDFLVRADSGHDNASGALKEKIDTIAVRKGLWHEAGTKIIKNHRGMNVLSSYSHLDLKKRMGTDFEWAIISEIEKAEAFAPVDTLRLQMLWLGSFLVLLSSSTGYIIGKSIAIPLKSLCDKVELMAGGELTVTIMPGKRSDEIGTLVDAFHRMLGTLRNQTQQITEGTHTIASSISQISTTATQLAASSSETSGSVSEIGSTVEEIRQTAYIANEKAEQVAKNADHAAHTYQAGKKATEDAILGMSRIREEMEYVAESIVKLSEQTQSIGEIISAVNDLADQSNLLSVNASIEAAKAGEHGKGFAVVAQEVKSLADQSKEATNQVKTILSDIQKATSTAVMATERGTKAVEAGVRLSGQSGDAIDRLSHNVMASTEAAVQIAASSQEQLTGMEQLVHAMNSIREASTQNVDGAKQLEIATKNLDALGQNLKQLALMFKI